MGVFCDFCNKQVLPNNIVILHFCTPCYGSHVGEVIVALKQLVNKESNLKIKVYQPHPKSQSEDNVVHLKDMNRIIIQADNVAEPPPDIVG